MKPAELERFDRLVERTDYMNKVLNKIGDKCCKEYGNSRKYNGCSPDCPFYDNETQTCLRKYI